MYIKGSQFEIQTPTQWNLIGHSMTIPSPVLSPSSILPPHSSRRAVSRKENFRAILKNVTF
jgi:hypothetical protein